MRRLLATTAIAMMLSGPVMAQQAEPAPPAPPTSADQRGLDVEGAVFEARMQAMGAEIEAAVEAGGGDEARTLADVDIVLSRYQSEIDAFSTTLETYLKGEAIKATDPEQKAGYETAAAQSKAAIAGIPEQVRNGIRDGLRRGAEPAAPSQ